MKVALFTPVPTEFIGGASKYTSSLRFIVEKNGCKPTIIRIPKIFRKLKSGKVKIIILNVYFSMCVLVFFLWTDRFHFIANTYFLLPIQLACLLKKKTIVDVRSHSVIRHLSTLPKKSRGFLRYIACSTQLVEKIQRITSAKCYLIYPPLEKEDLLAHYGPRGCIPTVVVYISSDEKYKMEQMDIIDKIFYNKNCPVRFEVFIGNQYVDKNYNLMNCNINRLDKNKFRSALSQAHHLLILGRSEGFPRVIVEARLHGLHLIIPDWLLEDVQNLGITSYSSYEKITDVINYYDYRRWNIVSMPNSKELEVFASLSSDNCAHKYAEINDSFVNNF